MICFCQKKYSFSSEKLVHLECRMRLEMLVGIDQAAPSSWCWWRHWTACDEAAPLAHLHSSTTQPAIACWVIRTASGTWIINRTGFSWVDGPLHFEPQVWSFRCELMCDLMLKILDSSVRRLLGEKESQHPQVVAEKVVRVAEIRVAILQRWHSRWGIFLKISYTS